jgi:hypothetical protein
MTRHSPPASYLRSIAELTIGSSSSGARLPAYFDSVGYWTWRGFHAEFASQIFAQPTQLSNGWGFCAVNQSSSSSEFN